jgi:prophage regulatory protein
MYQARKEPDRSNEIIKSTQPQGNDPQKGIYLHTQHQCRRLIRIKKVVELTGISKSYIYGLCNKNLFPKSVPLVKGGSSVAWVESEILDWIDSRISERNSGVKS